MHARLETIERQSFTEWFDACDSAGLTDYNWSLVPVGDALCSVSGSDHSILLNRVFGLGSKSKPSKSQLVEIRRLYEEAGVARFFVHVLPELLDAGTGEILSASGYRRHRGWMKFSRGPGDIREARSDLAVRRIGRDKATDFAAIVAPAFDLADSSQAAIAALVDAPNWHLYMSFDGDSPAGTGALYVHDGTGYLDWGATHPEYRRRGGQTAVLNTRLYDALQAGCETIVTMTGEAVPGDEQHSYGNILKSGFAEAYLRENWIPADS